MVIDFDLETIDPNSPRLLWRNPVLENQPPDATLEIVNDPATWNRTLISPVVTLTLDNPVACNAIAMAVMDWPGECVITVEFNDGVGGWQVAGSWQPQRGVPFMGLFPFQTAAQWRVSHTAFALSASVVRLGMALAMQRKLYVGVQPITKRVNKMPNGQLGAHYTGSRVVQSRRESGNLAFNKLWPDWVRAYFGEFVDQSRYRSVFVAWRPDTYPYEVVYGFVNDDVKVTNEMGNGMMQTAFSIEGSIS